MLTKYAEMRVLEASRGTMRPSHQVTAGRRTAHRAVFSYEPREGFIYVRSRAISSRCNDNFDEFPADEIKKAYSTFVGKPVFVNHHNDDHRRARGVILDAVLHEDVNPDGSPDTWVEVLMEVDAVKFPKLAKAILAGHIDRTSMGTDVAYSICSVCANKASSPLEYCKHIPAMKGQTIWQATASGTKEGVLVRELCYGLHFFENSLLVEDPADPTAFFLGVDDRGVGGGYEGNVKVTARRKHADRPENSWERGYNTEYEKNKEEILKGGPKCAICGEAKATEVDHIKSLKDGGSNGKSNLRPACKSCNRKDGGGERSDPKKSSLEVENMGKRNRRRQREAVLAGRTASRRHAYGEVKAPKQVDTLRPEDEDDITPVPPFADPDLDAAREMDLREELGDFDGDGEEQVDEALLAEVSEVLNEVRQMLAPDSVEEQVRDQLADLREMLEVSDGLDADEDDEQDEDGEPDEDDADEDDLPEFLTEEDEDDEDGSPVMEAGSPKEGVNRRRSSKERRMPQGRRRQAVRRVPVQPRLASARRRVAAATTKAFGDLQVGDQFTAPDRSDLGVMTLMCPVGQCKHEERDQWSAHVRWSNGVEGFHASYLDQQVEVVGHTDKPVSIAGSRRRPTAARRRTAATEYLFGDMAIEDDLITVYTIDERKSFDDEQDADDYMVEKGYSAYVAPSISTTPVVYKLSSATSRRRRTAASDQYWYSEGYAHGKDDAQRGGVTVEDALEYGSGPLSGEFAGESIPEIFGSWEEATDEAMDSYEEGYWDGLRYGNDHPRSTARRRPVVAERRVAKSPDDYTIDEKRALVGPIVTENGSGVVSGAKNRFATVIYDNGTTEEYSWSAIESIRSKTANRKRPSRRVVKGQSKMSSTLKTLAEVKRLLQEVKKNQRAVQAQVEYIGKAAGLERQLKVVRKRADAENPAQPVPEPASVAPAMTTEEARDHTDADLLTPGGVSEVSDVSEDLNVDLLTPGEVWPVELTDGGDVTAPVAGTTEPNSYDEMVTRPEVQHRGLDTELAYDESQPLFGEEAKEARFVAALRLARLRLQAGIASGDDLTLATSISQSKMKTSAIRQEIKTLDEVVKAGQKKPVSRTAARRLVPKAAGRTAPSMAAEAVVTSPTAPLAVSSEEFLWD